MLDGSEFEFERPRHRSRPLPFRRSNRRSGRIPAEPYPPFEFLQYTTGHSGRKALNPRGSGTTPPPFSNASFLIDCSVIGFSLVPAISLPASGIGDSDAPVARCRTGSIVRFQPALPPPTGNLSGTPPRI